MIGRVLLAGLAGSLASAAAAALCSRAEHRPATRPLNAIAHIADGGPPPAHDGRYARNTWVGLATHTAASVWWAAFYEGFFGRQARRSLPRAVGYAAAVSAAAYVVDFGVVGKRFRPGFEAYLPGRALIAIYAALGLGFVAAARLRRLRDHQIEDHHERSEGWPAQHEPDAVVVPEERR